MTDRERVDIVLDERLGTVHLCGEDVRYRLGNESGNIFAENEDFDGYTLTVEVRSQAQADAALAALSPPAEGEVGELISELLQAVDGLACFGLGSLEQRALDTLSALHAENAAMREENAAYADVTAEAWSRAERAEAERDALREALEVYADPCDASESSPCGYEGNLCCKTARAAIARADGGAS